MDNQRSVLCNIHYMINASFYCMNLTTGIMSMLVWRSRLPAGVRCTHFPTVIKASVAEHQNDAAPAPVTKGLQKLFPFLLIFCTLNGIKFFGK
jgi:hypothetical protein